MFWIAAGVATIVLIEFLENPRGLSLADEGFLWFGVSQHIQGKRAIRDFYAYLPGRYMLAAPLYRLWPSIRSIRWSMTVFLCLTFVSISVIFKVTLGPTPYLLILGTLLGLTTRPRHKRIDATVAALLSAMLGLHLTANSIWISLSFGFVTALVLVINSNHFLYWTFGSALSFVILLPSPSLWELLLSFLLGLSLGLTLCSFLLFPSTGPLWKFLMQEFSDIRRRGSTQGRYKTSLPSFRKNWRSGASWITRVYTILFYLYLPFLCLLAVVSLMHAPNETSLLVLGALFAAFAYFHHAVGRADIDHFVQILGPGCCAITIVLSVDTIPLEIRALALFFGIGLVFSCYPFIPALRPRSHKTRRTRINEAGDDLFLSEPERHLVIAVRRLERIAALGFPVFFAPHFPGAYALLGIEAPTWSSFLLHNDGRSSDVAVCEDLEEKAVAGALISHLGIDDRDDLKFPTLYPETWNFLCSTMTREILTQDEPRLDLFLRADIDE